MAKKCNEKFVHTMIAATPCGIPIPLYGCTTETIVEPDDCIVIVTRWIRNPELDYCEKNGEDNTGILFEYYYQEEKINDGEWYANGNSKFESVYNTTTCPLPVVDPYRISMYVGTTWVKEEVVEIPYSASIISLKTYIKPIYQNFFLSLPAAKNFIVKDGTGLDITTSFFYDQEDVMEGFQPNKVYKKKPKFSAEVEVPFTLLIY